MQKVLKQTIEITEPPENKRLDKVLDTLLNDFSRSYIKSLIDAGHILVNGHQAKASTKVQVNDILTIDEPEPKLLDLEPVDLKLDIIYEDKALLVVNKPTGMVVHPADSVKTPTLVHGLLYAVDDLDKINDTVRPGIVHRIDKDTSGLLVVAKTESALKHLQDALKTHKVKREYYALVEGVIQHNKGKIEAPIGRDKKDRKNMAVVGGGKEAITHFEVVERFDSHTLIKCQLETGRTHQIRVHLAYIDHPIVGDPKYGRRKTDTQFGQFLHAASLGFTHPDTKEVMTFEAPLPEFFTNHLEELRGQNG